MDNRRIAFVVGQRRWPAATSVAMLVILLVSNSATLFESLPVHSQSAQTSQITPDYCGQSHCCSIIYYDENLQPVQAPSSAPLQLASSVAYLNGNSNSNSNSNGNQTGTVASIGIECQFITTEQLHDQFNRIKQSGLKVTSLVVRDSNLTTLSNLPQGVHELRKLVISNTSIDLEVLKEGSESLDQLTTLEIANEKISNIPQNFFQEMQSLKELRLDNDEIASLDGNAFHNLDDSLEVLDLRKNRFNRFPMAVKNLAQLAVLDLSDNDISIDTQENDLPEKLEQLLNLRELALNRINCTCEFSSSPFFEWIARTHISGVRCSAPDKLKHQEVIVLDRDEFCPRNLSGSASATSTPMRTLNLVLLLVASCKLARSLARHTCRPDAD